MAEPLTHAALVEAVARAIWEATDGAFPWENCDGDLRLDALAAARAALRAIVHYVEAEKAPYTSPTPRNAWLWEMLVKAADAGGGDE
jgi:hypothetical protein